MIGQQMLKTLDIEVDITSLTKHENVSILHTVTAHQNSVFLIKNGFCLEPRIVGVTMKILIFLVVREIFITKFMLILF